VGKFLRYWKAGLNRCDKYRMAAHAVQKKTIRKEKKKTLWPEKESWGRMAPEEISSSQHWAKREPDKRYHGLP